MSSYIQPAYTGTNYANPSAASGDGDASSSVDVNVQDACYLAYLGGEIVDLEQVKQLAAKVLQDLESGAITDPTIRDAAEELLKKLAPSGSVDSITVDTQKDAAAAYEAVGSDIYKWVKDNMTTPPSADEYFDLILLMTQTASATWVASDSSVQSDLANFFSSEGSPSGLAFTSQFLAAYIQAHPDSGALVDAIFLSGNAYQVEDLFDVFNGTGPYSKSGWAPTSSVSLADALSALSIQATSYMPGYVVNTVPMPAAPASPADEAALNAAQALQAAIKALQTDFSTVTKANKDALDHVWANDEGNDDEYQYCWNHNYYNVKNAGTQLGKDWAAFVSAYQSLQSYIKDPANNFNRQFNHLAAGSFPTSITAVNGLLRDLQSGNYIENRWFQMIADLPGMQQTIAMFSEPVFGLSNLVQALNIRVYGNPSGK